jgi:RNA polymerase sigma-70 factor (ECF subfamily)
MRVDEMDQISSGRSLVRDTSARSQLRRILFHLDRIEETKAWAYVLHDVCGYDLREVATITSSSVSAAQTRLVRGRRELEERLSNDPELGSLAAAEVDT